MANDTIVRVIADAAGYVAGMEKAKSSTASFLQSQEQAAQRTKVAQAAITEAATSGANASARQINAFVSQAARMADTVGKTRSQLLEQKAAQLGVTDSVSGYINKIKESEKNTASFGSVLKDVKGALLAVGAAWASWMAVANLILKPIDDMDKLSKLAQSTGITVESLTSLSYAADLAGVNNDDLGKSIVKLSRNMSDAARGTGDAQNGFRALGISVTDSNGKLKSTDTILSEVAAKFSTYKDGAEKTALAVNLFGKSGAAMIPMLNGGASGLADMKDEADRLGITLSTGAAHAAEEFNDSLSRLHAAQTGWSNQIVAEILPDLNKFATFSFQVVSSVDDVHGSVHDLAAFLGLHDWLDSVGMKVAATIDEVMLFINAIRAVSGSVQVVIADTNLALVRAQPGRNGLIGLKFDPSQAQQYNNDVSRALTTANKTLADANAAYDKLIHGRKDSFQQMWIAGRYTDDLPPGADFKGNAPSIAKTPVPFKDDAATIMLLRLREEQAALEAQLATGSKLTDAEKERAKFEQQIADIKTKGTLTADQKSLLANQDAIKAQLDKNVAVAQELKIKQEMIKVDTLRQSLAATLATDQQQYAQKLAAVGLGTQAQSELSATQKLYSDYQRQIQQIQRDQAKNPISADLYQQETDLLRKNLDDRLAAQKKYFDDVHAAQTHWQNGASTALQNYTDESNNAAKMTETAFTNGFKSLEDALVSFVQTGKLSFTTMVDSIIADLARLAIKQNITGPLASGLNNVLGNLFGSGDSGNLSGGSLSGASWNTPLGADGGTSLMGIGTLPFASGGSVPGSGSGDTVPAWLTPGEFVLTKEATSRIGRSRLDAVNNHFANGGIVAGGTTDLGAPNVELNVINQSSQPVQAKTAGPKFDGKKWVQNIFLTDWNNNGPIRQAVKAGV